MALCNLLQGDECIEPSGCSHLCIYVSCLLRNVTAGKMSNANDTVEQNGSAPEQLSNSAARLRCCCRIMLGWWSTHVTPKILQTCLQPLSICSCCSKICLSFGTVLHDSQWKRLVMLKAITEHHACSRQATQAHVDQEAACMPSHKCCPW